MKTGLERDALALTVRLMAKLHLYGSKHRHVFYYFFLEFELYFISTANRQGSVHRWNVKFLLTRISLRPDEHELAVSSMIRSLNEGEGEILDHRGLMDAARSNKPAAALAVKKAPRLSNAAAPRPPTITPTEEMERLAQVGVRALCGCVCTSYLSAPRTST